MDSGLIILNENSKEIFKNVSLFLIVFLLAKLYIINTPFDFSKIPHGKKRGRSNENPNSRKSQKFPDRYDKPLLKNIIFYFISSFIWHICIPMINFPRWLSDSKSATNISYDFGMVFVFASQMSCIATLSLQLKLDSSKVISLEENRFKLLSNIAITYWLFGLYQFLIIAIPALSNTRRFQLLVIEVSLAWIGLLLFHKGFNERRLKIGPKNMYSFLKPLGLLVAVYLTDSLLK